LPVYAAGARALQNKDDLDETVLGHLVSIGHANRLAIENATQGAALPSPICASIDISPVKDHVEINEVEL
tara:strand:+ start:923 stop:1132 length:210 start_codon:yes stop_codon:yes gene_type:complete